MFNQWKENYYGKCKQIEGSEAFKVTIPQNIPISANLMFLCGSPPIMTCTVFT